MRWQVIRSGPADADIETILRWTANRFGDAQARRYGAILVATLKALRLGPAAPGARRRPGLGPDLWSVRLSGATSRSRHVIYFIVDPFSAAPTIRLLRILHDAMDPTQHLPPDSPT